MLTSKFQHHSNVNELRGTKRSNDSKHSQKRWPRSTLFFSGGPGGCSKESKPFANSVFTNTPDSSARCGVRTSGAIRVGDWKLVKNGNRGDDAEGPAQPAAAQKAGKKAKKQAAAATDKDLVELFNIAEDPYEKTNLAEKNPEKVQDLLARLAKYAQQAVPPKSAPQAPNFQAPKVWGE